MSEHDITLMRIAQRYADAPDYKRTVDMALGVFHIPKHPEGECEMCDAQREREASPAKNPATVDTATSAQNEASPEGNDGVTVAGESLEQRWGRAILVAEEQQRRAREEQNQERDPATEPKE